MAGVGTRAGVAYVDVKLGNLSGLTKQMSTGVEAAAKAAAAKAGKEISKGIQAGAAGIGGIKGPNINTGSVDRLKRSLNEAAVAGRQLGKDLGVVGQQIVGVGRKAASLGQAFIRPLKPVGAAINNYLLKPLSSIASSVGSRIGSAARGVGNALAAPFRAAGNAARAFANEVKGRFSSAIADVGARMRLAGSSAAQFGSRVRNMWTVAKQTSPVLGALSGATVRFGGAMSNAWTATKQAAGTIGGALTGAATRFGGALKNAAAPMGNVIASSGRLGASLGRVGASFAGVAKSAGGRLVGTLRSAAGGFTGMVRSALSAESSIGPSLSRIGSGIVGVGKQAGLTGFMISNLGHTMTIAFTAPVAAIVALTLKLGGGLVNTMQNAKISFEAFTGSAKVATDTVAKLRKYATDSPIFDTQSAITYAKQLMGVGVTMKELFPSLNTIQYLTAKYGLTAQETDGIVLAWTQTLSKGKAYSEELTQQMSEHGIPIWQILAKAFGVSQAKMHEMVKDGQVDAKAFEKAMIKVGQAGDFDKVIKQKANTFQGVLDRMRESVANSLADAILKNQKPINDFLNNFSTAMKTLAANAGPFIAVIAKSLAQLGNALARAAKWFNNLPDSMKETIAKFVLLAAVAGPLVIVLGAVVGGIGSIGSALGGFIKGVGAVLTKLKGFGGILGLVALILVPMVKHLIDAYKHNENFRKSLGELWDAAKRVWAAIQPVVAVIGQLAGIAGKLAGDILIKLVEWLAKAASFVTKNTAAFTVLKILLAAVAGYFAGLWIEQAVLGVIRLGILAWTAAQWLLNIAMDANPIGLIVAAIAVLIAIIIVVIKYHKQIAAFFVWVWGKIWNFLKAFAAWISAPFIAAWNAVWGFLKRVGAWFAGPFVQFFVAAGKAIAKPFVWLYHNVILPIWEGIKLGARIVGFVLLAAFLIWQAALRALGAVFVWLYDRQVKPVFHLIAALANWLWVNILYPVFNAIKIGIKAVGDFFLWVYNHGIKPAFDAVARLANWLWVHVLYPAFNAMKNGMKSVGDFFLWVYNHLIKPMYDAVQRGINFLWVHVLAPAFNAIKAGARAWGNLFLWVFNHLIKPMYDAVARGINYLWVHVLFPAFNAIKVGWNSVGKFFRWVYDHIIQPAWNAVKNAANYMWVHVLYPVFNAIKHGWHLLGSLVKSVWNNVIKPVWHAVQNAAYYLKDKIDDAFEQAHNAVSKWWTKIKSAVKTPVVAVITFVKDGVLGSIKAAAEKFGFDGIAGKMKSAQKSLGTTIGNIKAMKTGGPLKGPGTGTSDSMLIRASTGEYVVRADAAKKLGRPTLDYMNRHGALPAFRSGGYVPGLITAIAKRLQSGITMTSGYRPGSVSLSGNHDLHSQGLAADLAGSQHNMDALAAKFYLPKLRTYLLEEIHARVGARSGWFVKNGHTVPLSYYGNEVPGHVNHVHIGMTQKSAQSLYDQVVKGGGGGGGKKGGSILDYVKKYYGLLGDAFGGVGGATIDWGKDVYDKYFKGPAGKLAGIAKKNGVLGNFMHDSVKMLWDKALAYIKEKIMSSAAAGGDPGDLPGGGKGSGKDFFSTVLRRLGIKVSSGALNALYAVTNREGDNNRHNPLNSVVPSGGSHAFNSVGVQAYKTFNDGINGTVSLLRGGHWKGVVRALKTGDMYKILAAFKSAYTWDPGITFPTAANILSKEASRRFDNGGWMEPGVAAVNATNKPELALNAGQGKALERRISGYDQPMQIYVNTPAVAMDEGQFTAVMTRVVNQNRGIRPN